MEEALESLFEVHDQFRSLFEDMADHLTRLDAQNAELVARVAALEDQIGKAG